MPAVTDDELAQRAAALLGNLDSLPTKAPRTAQDAPTAHP